MAVLNFSENSSHLVPSPVPTVDALNGEKTRLLAGGFLNSEKSFLLNISLPSTMSSMSSAYRPPANHFGYIFQLMTSGGSLKNKMFSFGHSVLVCAW